MNRFNLTKLIKLGTTTDYNIRSGFFFLFTNMYIIVLLMYSVEIVLLFNSFEIRKKIRNG